MHVGLSEVLLERNDLAAAAEHLQASTELGEHAGLPQHAYRWRVATARLRQAQGDLDGALELLDEAEPLYNTDFSPAVRPVAAMKARMQPGTRRRRRGPPMGDRPRASPPTTSSTTSASSSTSPSPERSSPARRRPTTRSDCSIDSSTPPSRAAAAAAPSRSSSCWPSRTTPAGTRPRPQPRSSKALVGAEPEGYVRIFVDAGPTIGALLRTIASHDQAGNHARRVLAAETTRRTPTPPRQLGLVDELSARELDVLRLLRSDLSGPDIARELLVSLNTLRTHTKNIYAKLGVNNRREAVRRAAELGL